MVEEELNITCIYCKVYSLYTDINLTVFIRTHVEVDVLLYNHTVCGFTDLFIYEIDHLLNNNLLSPALRRYRL